MRCFLSIVAILLFCVSSTTVVRYLWAVPVTYYVDTAADAGGDGTTTALTGAQAAFKTIAAVNASSPAAGDSVLFNRGCTWREQLTVPSSGSAGNVITFGAYGAGVDPIISGADLVTGWVDNSAGSYDWEWDAEEALPGDWTSETDTGGDLNLNAAAAYAGSNGIRITHNDTTNLYLLKTGLGPYASSVYAEFYIRFSSDFAYAAAGCTLFKIFYAADWLLGLNIEAVTEDTNVTVRFTRNKPGYAALGDEVLNVNTWYKIKMVATGIGTVAGVAQLWIADVKEREATGIDWSAGYSIDRVQMGVFAKFGAQTKIEGSIDFDEGWVDADGAVGGGVANTWKATVTTQPYAVRFNDTIGAVQSSVANCNGANEWYWVGNVLYVYSTSDPATAYTAPGIAAAIRDECLRINGIDYVTVQDLDIRDSNVTGVWYVGSAAQRTNGILQRLTVSNVGQTCIRIGNAAGVAVPNNVSILDNTLSYWGRNRGASYVGLEVRKGDGGGETLLISGNTLTSDEVKVNPGDSNGYDGIFVCAGDPVTIESNTITGCGHAITVKGPTGGFGRVDVFTIRYNYIYAVHDDCIWFVGITSTGNNIYYNVFNAGTTSDQGLDLAGGTINVYNNVFANMRNQVLIFHNVATTLNFKNNICYEWDRAATGVEAIYSTDDTFNPNVGSSTYSNNIYYHSGANNVASFPDYGSDTLAQWQTDSGQDANSSTSNPVFVSVSDFHLQGTSPCINKGVSVGLMSDYAGHHVPSGSAPDIGAYEFIFGGFRSLLGGVR